MGKTKLISLFLATCIPVSAYSRQNIHFDTDTIADTEYNLMINPDTVLPMKVKPWQALAEDLGVNAVILAFDRYVQNRSYARVTGATIKHNFRTGFVWDNDSFSGNQFSHPYHGSMFYNAARQNGLNYWQSLAYPIIGSLTWEYFCETNEPAINDLLSTGIGGSAIGEVTHRSSDLIFDNRARGFNRVIREIGGSLLNPIRGIHRLFTGEMWKVGPIKGRQTEKEPFELEVGAGNRYISSESGFKGDMNVPYVEFTMNYGDRMESDEHKPFDWFYLYLLANISSDQSSIGDMDIWGRLWDKKFFINDKFAMDLGIYQMVKYVETYPVKDCNDSDFPIISEAVSAGPGLFCEYKGRKTDFNNDLIIGGIALGGSRTDYYKRRKYNFGSGFSIRDNIQINIADKFRIGNRFYFGQLYSSGYSPEELNHRLENGIKLNTQGDSGSHSIITNKTYLQVEFLKNVKLNLEHAIYYRKSNYKYYESVSAKSYEYNIGLIYCI